MSLPVPERMAKLRDPAVRQWMNERARSPEAGVFSRLASWGRYQIGDTYSAANDGLEGPRRRRSRRAREPRHVRHAARHRHQRRPADDPLAAALRQRPEVVADARRGVGPPARAGRRQRRRRAPRPHVRRAVHHVVPRRHDSRPPAHLARAVRAADDAGARAAVRPARPGRAARGLPRRRRDVRSRRRSRPTRSSSSTTCPAAPLACSPTRSACSA